MTSDWTANVLGAMVLVLAVAVPARQALAAGGGRAGAEECRGPDYSTVDVLDPHLAADAKRPELDKLRQNAGDPNCRESRYLLGHLFRHGQTLPGNLVPQDTVQARKLIEEFALRGNAWAFADLAELAIVEKQGREALKWTQVYLYLVARTDEKLDALAHSGYNGDLLLRAQEAARKAKVTNRSDVARSELNAYIKAHHSELLGNRREVTRKSSEVSSGISGVAGVGEEGLRIRRRPTPEYVDFGRLKPGYAVYLMEVQPDGRVSRIVPSSFGLTPEHATRLRRMIEGWEFYPHRGEKATLLRVPVEYGYANGPKLKVPPRH